MALELHAIKEATALALSAGYLLFALGAALRHFRRRSLNPLLYVMMNALRILALLQVMLGVVLWLQGFRSPFMHILYGVLVGLAVIGQWALQRSRTGGTPLQHAAVGLVISLLTARAWMSVNHW